MIRTAEYNANLRWWLEETSATATSVRRANERLFLSMSNQSHVTHRRIPLCESVAATSLASCIANGPR